MIEYEEDWIPTLLFRRQGSVASRAVVYALPSAMIGVLLLYLDDFDLTTQLRQDMSSINTSQVWTASTACIILLLSFRTKQGLSRFWEGTGLLHQMRGEWFDTVSNCVTFSISAKKIIPKEVNEFRHTIVRLMSLAHGSALEEIAGNQVQIETIDIFGLDAGTLRHLKECHEVYKFNKVEVMLHLVQSLITKAHEDGVLKIPPPILSRVFQTISRGFVNLLNAKKITDTRFPFPYAQLITFLLLALTFLTPLMLSNVIYSKFWVAIFTFVPIFGMFSLNFIAIELENPFGVDDNDLPLANFQSEMNNCLLMLLHPGTDLIASISPACEMDFRCLYKAMYDESPEELADPSSVPMRKTRLSQFESKRDSDTSSNDINNDDNNSNQESVVLSESGRIQSIVRSSEAPIGQSAFDRHTSPDGYKDHSKSYPDNVPIDVDQMVESIRGEDVRIQEKLIDLDNIHGIRGSNEELSLIGAFTPLPTPVRVTQVELVSGRKGATNTPLGVAEEYSNIQPLIAKSMEDFNRSLRRWTVTIEDQLSQISVNFQEIKVNADTMRPPGSRPVGSHPLGWEVAVPPV